MNLADCGHDVFVGDFLACDQVGATFDLAIHVFSLLNVREGRLCRCCRDVFEHKAIHHLVVMYEENRPLETASVPTETIFAYARQPGRLLAHCAAGSVRGPTLAITALVARGVPFGQAVEAAIKASSSYGSHPLGNAALKGLLSAAG